MTALPPPDERIAANIAMLLDHMPPDRADAALNCGALRYYHHAVAIGWPTDDAIEITVRFLSSIARHWYAAAACRMQ